MARMMNTAEQQDVLVDVNTLNAYPLADVFVAIGPARVVAEGVTVGPVVTDDGEWFLVRFDGHAGQLKRTEAEALEAAAPSIRRHVSAIEFRRHLGDVAAKRAAEIAKSIAACPGHQLRSYESARCLRRYACACGYVETLDSSD